MSNNNEVTTGEIMEFLQEHMVTKEELKDELKGFATKEDLKAFATKEDLKAFATKEDLNDIREDLKGFATKEDLTRDLRKMQEEILDGVDEKLFNLKGDLVIIMRKGDHKLAGLISLLQDKSVISEKEAQALLMMEPFPQLFTQ